MAVSTTLSVWAFSTEPGAQRAARGLAAACGAPALADAAVVSWPASRPRPLAWQARDLATDGRLSGAFWGLLFAQLFLLPLSLQTPPALATAQIDDALGCLGVDAGFLSAVRDGVRPGHSALFLLDTVEPGRLTDRLGSEAVALADLRLTTEQEVRLHAGFDED